MNYLQFKLLEILDHINHWRFVESDPESGRDQRYIASEKISEYQEKLEQVIRDNINELFQPMEFKDMVNNNERNRRD